jgi:hypothetical protein
MAALVLLIRSTVPSDIGGFLFRLQIGHGGLELAARQYLAFSSFGQERRPLFGGVKNLWYGKLASRTYAIHAFL